MSAAPADVLNKVDRLLMGSMAPLLNVGWKPDE